MSLRRVGLGCLLAIGAASATLPSAAVAAPASPLCPVVPGARAAPTATQALGRSLTAAPPSPTDTVRYLEALDAASPRVILGLAGTSGEGRPLRYAVVGDPATLGPARLATIAKRARAVRAGATGPTAVARAAGGPTIVWLGGGVHANEPSGTTALLSTIRRLASDDSCATRRILRNVVTVVLPDQNPDGHVDGTRTDASGFDLNRDWFAAARPETTARLGLLRDYPPTVAIDFHEQTGSDYFTPPYANPILPGLPAAARRVADRVVAPAAARALRSIGATATSADGYDLLYPGYADSATSLLFGSGGMTFEQGSDPPLATKTRRHETAALAALAAVADRRERIVRAWAAGFRVATESGRAGRGNDGSTAFAWVLRTDTHAADAYAVAQRLSHVGVRVRTLRAATTIGGYRALGGTTSGPVRLPAGTIVVPADQPLQRWVDVLLGRDGDRPGPRGAGDDTWSLPWLAGVEAGVLERPLDPAGLTGLQAPPTVPATAGSTVGFPGDSAAAAALVGRLTAEGRTVRRDVAGDYRTAADPTVVRRAAATGLVVRPTPPTTAGDGTTDVIAPQVAVIADDSPTQTGPPALLPGTTGDRSSGWIPATLRAAGIPTTIVDAARIPSALAPGTTHVVLGPAALSPAAARTPAVREALDRFVRDGGRVVAVGTGGVSAAVELGISTVRTVAEQRRHAVTVTGVPAETPIGRALGGRTRVVLDRERRLTTPPSASVALRSELADRPLVIDEARGAGHVLSLGFSPVFRGQSAGGARVLLGLLLPSREQGVSRPGPL